MNNTFFKKITATALSAVMCLSLFAGCGNSKDETPDNSPSAEAPTASQGSFSKEMLDITVNGKTLKLGENESRLEEVFGKPLNVEEAVSCMFDGFDKTYTFEACTVFTFPAEDGSGNIVDEVWFSGDNVPELIKGIGIGSSKADVVKVLGDKYFMQGEAMMVYNAENSAEKYDSLPMLYFMIEADTVTGIGYCANLYHTEA